MTDAPTTLDQDDAPTSEEATLSAIYSLLALTMRYPDGACTNDQLFDTLEALLTSLDRPAELTALSDWRHRSTDPLDDLRTEYTRLFINAVPHVTVPPYASVYLDGSGILQGPTTERTRDFYREHGYDLASETEPADHLALELDFLAALTGEGQAEAEEVFLRTLFRPWFTRFKERCMQEVRHPFYTVSIQLIDFFTKEEQ